MRIRMSISAFDHKNPHRTQGCSGSVPAVEEDKQQGDGDKNAKPAEQTTTQQVVVAQADAKREPQQQGGEEAPGVGDKGKNTRARRLSYITGDQNGKPVMVRRRA